MNCFSLGAQVGGRFDAISFAQEQELRNVFNAWKGDYSSDIREFAFLLRIDGSIHTYTEMWNILGAQKAKRKRDWVEVEIGIPESWWREAQLGGYKKRLVDEIEKGFVSMIDLLRRNRRHINADLLLSDWNQVKSKYLAAKTPTEQLAGDYSRMIAKFREVQSRFNLPKDTIQ